MNIDCNQMANVLTSPLKGFDDVTIFAFNQLIMWFSGYQSMSFRIETERNNIIFLSDSRKPLEGAIDWSW